MAVGLPVVAIGAAAQAVLPYGEGQPTAVEHADMIYQEHGEIVKKFVDFTDKVTLGLLGPGPGAVVGIAANPLVLPYDLAKFTAKVGTGVAVGVRERVVGGVGSVAGVVGGVFGWLL